MSLRRKNPLRSSSRYPASASSCVCVKRWGGVAVATAAIFGNGIPSSCRGANVQDCAVVHVTPRGGTEIGAGSTVGHNCTIHAASLGEECLIGNGATVLDGARIGARAMVAAGALVTPETEIPEGTLALGAPAKVRGPLAGTPAERWVRANPEGYQALAQRHKASVQPC